MLRILLLFAAIHGVFLPASRADASAVSERFHLLLEQEWNRTMEANPTWASQLGDRRFNGQWEDLSSDALDRAQAHRRQLLENLNSIPRASLPSADRLNHDLLKYETELAIEEHSHRSFLIALNQREGIQTSDDLADALRFETVQDYEQWIERLRAFSTYARQTITLLRTGIKERILQPKITMKRVPAQLDKHITDQPDASPFFKPFTRFPASIPESDRTRLAAAAKEAIASSVTPAFRMLKGMFESEYLPACLDSPGAWQWPNGDKIYAFLARKFTTTTLSPMEIHDIGLSEVARISREMEGIMKSVGFQGTRESFFTGLRSEPRFYCKTPDELLTRYRAVSKRIDPQLVRLFATIPRAPYGVDPIPDSIAPDTTAAYYRPLSADGTRAGTYFVNLYKPEMRPTYEMMALSLHEAVPGHHFQFAIAMEQGGLPKFRRYGGEKAYTAYIEGWALYAESLGDEMGLYDDPYSKFGQLTYEMWRAVRLVVDTGLHAFKWDRQRAIDYFLSNAAKSELDVVNEIDRYISWPGQALAYKIGELKIKELRVTAAKALGAKFNVKEFHDVILKCGPAPLDVLERIVGDWVASK